MIQVRPARAYVLRKVSLAAAASALLSVLAFGQPPGDQTRDLRRVRQEQESNPILRLNTGGHTAVVRGLAFLPDSERLCSAGLDKDVQVWNLKSVFRDLRRVFLRERTIRWQVARGLRGSIYALDAAPNDGLLAIGGYGAMGSTGEILLVNPLDGSLAGALDRHRQTVSCLAFSADGAYLASIDLDGRATVWKREGWQPSELDKPDTDTYGAERAKWIAASTDIRPIAVAGSTQVVLPRLTNASREGDLRWQLRLVDLADATRSRLLETVHRGMVTALAATRDGRLLASADLEGHLYLWDLRASEPPRRLDPGAMPISLAFSPDGKRLALGTAVRPAEKESQVQVWDVASRTPLSRLALSDHVWACRISPDGTKLAYGGGKNNEVFLAPLDHIENSVPLRGMGTRVLKVAFNKAGPSYRIGFGWDVKDRGFNDYADIQAVFDPEKLQLDRVAPPGEDWLTAESFRGNWSVKRRDDGILQLYRNTKPAGTIELDPVLEGAARSYCWVPASGGPPAAIAVGTDRQNTVHVFQLVEAGPCPTLRQYRGHADYVASVGASSDGRYLVSGSADGTVCIWSLESFQRGAASLGRWGAEFSVKNNELVATKVLPSGPLFAKGLREGDVLSEIRWPVPADQGAEQTEGRPEEIVKRLEELPWMTQVRFTVAGRDGSRSVFQRVPAWQPLANLFAGASGEWAYWTPEGYYDASINGHTLFGWQVNRGLDALPDFYRADQYQQTLERPEVMSRLLAAGSLQEALDDAAQKVSVKLHEVLPQKIAATPRVEILSPRPGTVIQDGFTRVRARISTPQASKLVKARVFANGVVATERQTLEQRDLADGSEVVYEWNVPLPADERALIQLVAATDAPTGAFSNVLVDRSPLAGRAERQPRLYLLAVGINQYSDKEVPTLAFSVADAKAVAERMELGSEKLYALEDAALMNDAEVTPENWRAALERIAQELKASSRPDDLLVVFMAGHGVVEPERQTYYYLGHHARLVDIESGDFRGCISWQDFRSLADVPCRKLVVLDTCHSGAIQPLQDQGLKTGVRALQEDVVLAVTASAGHEKAAENKSLGHGVFTKCLLEALSGRADASGDGLVTLDEVIAYVTRSVAEATEGRQNPSAGPNEILPFVTLPLARVSRPATGG